MVPLHPNSRLVLCHVPLAPREKGHEYPTEDPELNIMELLLWRNGTGIGGIFAAPGSLARHRGLKDLALPQLRCWSFSPWPRMQPLKKEEEGEGEGRREKKGEERRSGSLKQYLT